MTNYIVLVCIMIVKIAYGLHFVGHEIQTTVATIIKTV